MCVVVPSVYPVTGAMYNDGSSPLLVEVRILPSRQPSLLECPSGTPDAGVQLSHSERWLQKRLNKLICDSFAVCRVKLYVVFEPVLTLRLV